MVIPNGCDDGEANCKPLNDKHLQFDTFLKREIPLIEASPAFGRNGVIVVTYDEDQRMGGLAAKNGLGSGGHTICFVISPLAVPGDYGAKTYSYSVLRTLQDGLGLSPYLGAARRSSPLPLQLALGREREDREVGRRRSEEERVEPVEHAAVAAEQRAAVLHARVALQQRLEQVAERAGDRDDRARARSTAGSRGSAACTSRRTRRTRSRQCRTRSPPTSCPVTSPAPSCGGRGGDRRGTRACPRPRLRAAPCTARAARASAGGAAGSRSRARRRSTVRPSPCC